MALSNIRARLNLRSSRCTNIQYYINSYVSKRCELLDQIKYTYTYAYKKNYVINEHTNIDTYVVEAIIVKQKVKWKVKDDLLVNLITECGGRKEAWQWSEVAGPLLYKELLRKIVMNDENNNDNNELLFIVLK